MYFTDKVPITQANYILSLPDDVILTEMYDADELTRCNEDTKFNSKTYLKRLKDFCQRVKACKGDVKQKYTYSQRLGDKGRLFVKHFGIQSLQHKLRGFLCQDNYVDFDMKNAHPTILNYLVQLHFPYDLFPELEKYVKNKDKLLEKFKASKRDILISMNCDKPTMSKNKLVIRLDKEFKRIQELFWNSDEYDSFKVEKNKNSKGSFLNTILCVEENKILQLAMKNLKVSVPMFDGFLMLKTEVEGEGGSENVIAKLNDITNEYGIVWAQKPHDTTIQIDEDLLEDMDDDSYKDYDTLKIEFEEKYFLLRNPTCFVEEIDNAIVMRSKADFVSVCETYVYHEADVKGHMKEKNFFKQWLKDKDRREFNAIDYIPTFNDIPKGIYNTFNGFDFMGEKLIRQDAIDTYLNHLKLLVNYEEESFEYLVGYLAHLIQKPDELTEIGLVFKSKQGVGKDAMIDFLQKILGKETVYRTADLDTVFSRFNGELKNRLILQLNEVQGSEGFAKRDKLKDLMTSKEININEKNVKPYKISNYMRFFFFSNNLTPIDIPHDDRRYCVFKCGEVKERTYYDNLYSHYNNDDSIESIAYFLRNYDLSKFKLKNRPKTSAYKEMQSANVHPLYEFLYDHLIVSNPADIFEDDYHKHKKTAQNLIKPYGLQREFHCYLESMQQTYIKHDYKILKLLLGDMGISSKPFKVKMQPTTNYYQFPKDSAELLKLLEKQGFIPQEVEEA